MLVVAGSGDTTAGDRIISGVTYNAVAMTNVWGVNGTTWVRNEGWRLTAPASGAHNVVVTYGGPCDQACAGAVTYSGVDQTTPIGTPASAGGASATASVAVTSATGEVVIGGVSSDPETITPTGTQRWEVENVGSDTSYGEQTYSGAASVTVQWNLGSSDNWAVGGVSIKPSGAAATSLVYGRSQMNTLLTM